MSLDNVFSRDIRGLPHFMDEPTAAMDPIAEQNVYLQSREILEK